ncbi:uncharacterized protein V1518DRAFT_410452 [Limtongia smithiae]|uniref:uncharacterized protein n=1 Tax=Limtongia smithiae TaxID=1125753 RepID=UPI0034CF435A
MTIPAQSWVEVAATSHFSLRNIPFGIISTTRNSTPRPATVIGDYAFDLFEFSRGGGFVRSEFKDTQVFEQPTLNAFAALGRQAQRTVRSYLQKVLTRDGLYADILEHNSALRAGVLVNLAAVKMHLPFQIGDYTDFFVGRNHAYNCGVIFRGPENALNPNYYHVPVGYHGRASSIVVSGTDLKRPCGQILEDPTAKVKRPVFQPSKKLDYELEFAAFIGKENRLGERVPIDEAEEYIFGFVVMNDWSARDIQAWEYVPLGPFTAKNFGTSISAWVVTPDALEAFRTKPIVRPPEAGDVMPYLSEKREDSVYDVKLEIDYMTAEGDEALISTSSTKHLLFSFPQLIAHHTVSGCNLRVGDLLASGTISGEDLSSVGSLLEKSQAGKKDIVIGNSARKFLQDGDGVKFRACADDGLGLGLVGFGEVSGRILKAEF